MLDDLLIQVLSASATPIINFAANLHFPEFIHSISTDNQATTIFDGGNILYLEDDQVNSPDSFPGIQSQGQVIVIGGDYQALTPNAGASAPDFLLQPTSSLDVGGGAGKGFFQHVRFGPESESPTHVRIKVSDPTPTNVLVGLRIEDCSFGASGFPTSAPIEFDNPVTGAIISGNSFLNYPWFINDAHPPISVSQDNVFTKTNIVAQGIENFKGVCINGCVGFSNVESPGFATLGNLQSWRSTNWSHEQNSISNLIINSETYRSWAPNNVTITLGQTDPYGTTRAALLTGGGNNANEQVILSFQPPPGVSTVFFSIWAKAGTASLMDVSLIKSLNALPISIHSFALTSSWQQYYAVYAWDRTATSGSIVLSIANPQNPLSLYVFAPEASSGQPSDYIPTTVPPVAITSAGLRFERDILFGGSSHLVSPALATPTINGNNPAVFYAPITSTLAANVSLKANTATTVVSSAITTPSTGGPFRALTNYAIYWNTPKNSGMSCEAWITDGTNTWAASENQNFQSSGHSGNSGFGLSTVTYTNGQAVTLILKVLCDKAGAITASPPQVGPPNTHLQSVVVAAN